MALNQITYTDKVENNGATDDGKVLATNMNEIKTVTNGVIDSLEDTEVKIGSSAGATSQSANSVSVGYLSGQTSQGINSVAVGHLAGQTSQGGYAVSIGVNAGNGTQGLNSVSVGRSAGFSLQGENSVAIGSQSGQTSQGSNCVAIGNLAGQTNQPTNSTCLGNNAQVTALNQVQLGNSSTTTYAYGAVQDRSDLRDKADVQDVHLGLEFLEALTPRSYKFDYREDYREHTTELQDVVTGQDEDGNDITEEQEVFVADTRKLGEIEHDGTHVRSRLHCGLVAQEVKQVMDDLGVDFAGYQDHGIAGGDDVLSIGYGELISPMIKAIQELSARVKALESE